MKKSRIAAVAAVLAWSLLVGMNFTLQAQGDTPITVSNGSLHIESAVPWGQFQTQGSVRAHPHTHKSVPRIEVTLGGNTQAFEIGGQPCEVEVKYGSTTLRVGTGANGRGLSVDTDFTSFRRRDENHLDHTDATKTISSITVAKAGKRIFQGSPSGAVTLVIHYQ